MPQIYLTQRRCAYSRRWLSCASNDGYSPWRHLCHHLMAITSSSSPGQYVSMWLHLAYVSTQILTDPNPSSTLYLVPLFFLDIVFWVLFCLHTMSITNKISWFKKLSPYFESLLILSSREDGCPLYKVIGPPRSSWDLLNSFHPSVRAYVRWRSKKPIIGLF